jgi:tetratricopeptide (TPR) repeat protein
LPVHHLSGESGSVYAYSDELDGWLRKRGRTEFIGEVEDSGPGIPATDVDRNPAAGPEGVFEPCLISESAKVRSGQLVALAARMWHAVSHRNLTRIVQLYREAIDLNPDCAEGYAGLSFGLITQGAWGLVFPPVAYASAKAALEQALVINPGLPEAKCASAWLNTLSTRLWEGAILGFDELLKCALPCRGAIDGRGLMCIAEGSPEEASLLFEEAARQSPLSTTSIALRCWAEYLAGESGHALELADEARATGRSGPILDAVEALATVHKRDWKAWMDQIEELATESPHQEVLCGVLGYAYALSGQSQKSRELLDELTIRTKGRTGRESYAVALIHIGLNERQQAVHRLHQSYCNGSLWSIGFQSDPILAALRNDPSYRQFLSKCSYPKPKKSDLPPRAVA